MTVASDIDDRAWADFIARLRRFVGARVPPTARDDVVGDILLRLVRHQDKLAAARDPLAWVGRIATNAVIDHGRRRGAERRAMGAYAAETALADDEPLPDAAVDAEVAACVMPMLARLPAPYRETLELVEIDGLSQRQAAERLGLSLSAVKSRVQRGRRQLKQAFLRCCAIELDRRGGVVGYQSRTETGSPVCCSEANRSQCGRSSAS